MTQEVQLDSAIFYTNDLKKAVRFYEKKIGFILEYQQAEKYASFLIGDRVRLGLCKSHHEREVVGAQTIILRTTNAEELYLEFKKTGFLFSQDFAEYDWGKIFSIFDPDQNKIEFLERKSLKHN